MGLDRLHDAAAEEGDAAIAADELAAAGQHDQVVIAAPDVLGEGRRDPAIRELHRVREVGIEQLGIAPAQRHEGGLVGHVVAHVDDEGAPAGESWAALNVVGEHYRALMTSEAFYRSERFEDVVAGIDRALTNPDELARVPLRDG